STALRPSTPPISTAPPTRVEPLEPVKAPRVVAQQSPEPVTRETPTAVAAARPVAERATRPPSSPPALLQPPGIQSVSATSADAVSRGPVLPSQRPERQEEWEVMLSAAIRSLEERLRASGEATDPQCGSDQKTLRLLYVAAGRREDALRPIVELSATGQQFWNEWCFGTSICLEESAGTDDPRQATLAARHLREAVSQLGLQSNLEVRNLAFCRRVTSFGVYDRFVSERPAGAAPAESEGYVFAPDQEVLIYAEIGNFASRPTAKGFHTELRAGYQILDGQGRRIGPLYDLGVSHDYCQQRRTDFFVRFHRHLPAALPAGRYQLTLTIEDLQSNKVGESSVPFTVVAGG
ncbi:MAG: hypothetical protein WD176_06000, partial [Pirellulales bacterium]